MRGLIKFCHCKQLSTIIEAGSDFHYKAAMQGLRNDTTTVSPQETLHLQDSISDRRNAKFPHALHNQLPVTLIWSGILNEEMYPEAKTACLGHLGGLVAWQRRATTATTRRNEHEAAAGVLTGV